MTRKTLVTMGRFSKLHPVNSVKKVIDISGALASGTVSINPIANVASTAWVDAGDANVPQGSRISSVYLSIFMYIDAPTASSVPLLEWFLCKNPGSNLTFPAPGAVGADDNKRWVLHEEKGLSGDIANGGTPMVFKGVIKIPGPKGKMSKDDQLQVRLLSPNHAGFFCLKAIYKFYQ